MKLEENILDMKKHFIHIVNYMIILGKFLKNEDLIIKILRRLNRKIRNLKSA